MEEEQMEELLKNTLFLKHRSSFILLSYGFSSGSLTYRTFWVRSYITPMILFDHTILITFRRNAHGT